MDKTASLSKILTHDYFIIFKLVWAMTTCHCPMANARRKVNHYNLKILQQESELEKGPLKSQFFIID